MVVAKEIPPPRRMLKDKEAAFYCGRSLAAFKRECPCRPVLFENNDRRYDVRDLDAWLDAKKSGIVDDSDEAILAAFE